MKNIVICSDGTNSEYGALNTNVVRLYEAIIRDGEQIAFYDPGVGTFGYFGREIGRRMGKVLGMVFGAGLQQNVEDAYRYLMDHYEEKDKVYLFGFSRGAYTVRALAGMLHECGLLEKGSDNLVPYASKIYNRRDRRGDGCNKCVAAGFKGTYSRECNPHFIGVWDTVGSLGWVAKNKEFNVRLNGNVAYCYQAVAIDERRRQFPVSLWDESRKHDFQTIEQVWFPGSHSDVGGWNKRPRIDTAISDVTLEWMLQKARYKGLRLRDGWRDVLKSEGSVPAVVNESWRGPWRLWSPKRRHICEGARVHASVERLKEETGGRYRPSNLPPPGKYTVVE